MTGRQTGVAVRLQGHSPKMIAVHCVNHRLALATAHASDSVPYLKQFKSILQTVFYCYQNSAVRMGNLHAIQEVLNDPLIKCKLAKYVRWLSHDNAIKALVHCLPSILVTVASENGEPTAHGLLNFMKTYKFVACLYLLSDVLPHLCRLSRIFQKEDVDLSLIQPCLKTTIDAIKEYLHCPGPNLSKDDHALETDFKLQLLLLKWKPSKLMFNRSTENGAHAQVQVTRIHVYSTKVLIQDIHIYTYIYNIMVLQ